MSPLRQLYELARRDFLQRARSRGFLVSMAVTVGLVLAAGPIIAIAVAEPDPMPIAVVGGLPIGAELEMMRRADELALEVEFTAFDSVADAEDALDSGDAYVVIVESTELVWRKEASPRLAAVIVGAFSATEQRRLGADMGLSAEELSLLTSPVAFSNRVLEQPDPEDQTRQAAAIGGLAILYLSILMFGQFVLMGVMEEKQNRVVEVVLSRVRPIQVLAGKVIGIGLLGLIQMLTLSAAAFGVVSLVEIANVDLSGIGLEVILSALFWYLFGYAFYSTLYGALGATVSRPEDAQGAVLLPLALIIPGFLFGQIAVENPDSLLAKIGSFVPLWMPMVMPVRSAVSDVPQWQIGLSILMVVLATYGVARLGSHIYTGAILRLGSKVRLRDAWKTSRG